MTRSLATAIALAALTGTRRSELVALQWSDVDLTAGRVKVWKGLTVANGRQYIGDTKTHAARELALDRIAVEVLRRRWEFMVATSTEGESPLVHPRGNNTDVISWRDATPSTQTPPR